MAKKQKVREISLVEDGNAFSAFFKKFTGESEDYDLEGVSALRSLFSNEKARLLHTIKSRKPSSLYLLAKVLQRDFKSVFKDIKLLERFGFIDLISEKTGKRRRLKPIVTADEIIIKIKI